MQPAILRNVAVCALIGSLAFASGAYTPPRPMPPKTVKDKKPKNTVQPPAKTAKAGAQK